MERHGRSRMGHKLKEIPEDRREKENRKDYLQRIEKGSAVVMALIAALLYGISSPLSKLLLAELPPLFIAVLLYLGAGLGMSLLELIVKGRGRTKEASITKKELPYVLCMLLLDIGAPVFLMFGLQSSNPASVSLLNNFEIVATSLIALLIFKEAVGKRMWAAIALITFASILLSIEDIHSLSFSLGAVFVLLACICWGFENNCTRMLSIKDPIQIVVIKGIGSGTGALLIALLSHSLVSNLFYCLLTMLLGFVAYGLSIYFYIRAQRVLGASRTSAYYAAAPFIGVFLSFIIFREEISHSFWIAFFVMLAGTIFIMTEVHDHIHTHEAITHEHLHNHRDGHHDHIHEPEFAGEHSHEHTHLPVAHSHTHTPDMHHQHRHGNN